MLACWLLALGVDARVGCGVEWWEVGGLEGVCVCVVFVFWHRCWCWCW